MHLGATAAIGSGLDFTLRKLPRPWVPVFAACLANLTWPFSRRHVLGRGLPSLDIAFGEGADRKDRIRLLHRGYLGQAVCLFEAMALSDDREALRARVTNWAEVLLPLRAAMEEGRGVVILTAHLGSWELCGQVAATEFPMVSVARRTRGEGISRLLVRIRERQGGAIVFHDEGPRKLVAALRDGKLVGIVADHAFRGVTAAEVEFFGRTARFPVSPFTLARKSGSPVFFAVAIRAADGSYRLEMEGPHRIPSTAQREADAMGGLERWVRFLEDRVRAHPESWLPITGYWKHGRRNVEPGGMGGQSGDHEADAAQTLA